MKAEEYYFSSTRDAINAADTERSWQYEIAQGSTFNRDSEFSPPRWEKNASSGHTERLTGYSFLQCKKCTGKGRSKRNWLPLSLLGHAWHSDILAASDSLTPGIYTILSLRVWERKLRDSKNMWCFWKYGIKIAMVNYRCDQTIDLCDRNTSFLEFQWTETDTLR